MWDDKNFKNELRTEELNENNKFYKNIDSLTPAWELRIITFDSKNYEIQCGRNNL